MSSTKSCLAHKLSLCDLFHQIELDENACVNVIRSICHELMQEDMKRWMIKMIIQLPDSTRIDSLVKIENSIKDIITPSDCNNEKISKNNENSKLLRLPLDLICKTSLFLNEKDIFNFEECCRLFYKIINNSSYLNQSNTFKQLRLTSERLDQMTQYHNSFYKYCKSRKLIVEWFDQLPSSSTVAEWGKQIQTQFDKAQMVDKHKWLTSMFKSIKTLEVRDMGTLLFDKFPVDILFDPMESNLENIIIDTSRPSLCESRRHVDKFKQKYVNLKQQLECEGEKIKVLKCVKQKGTTVRNCFFWSKLYEIESKHICMNRVNINFSQCSFDVNPRLHMLTFEGVCKISGISNQLQLKKRNLHIDTLRFINGQSLRSTAMDILENSKLIESLNFQNTVKNLTFEVTFGIMDESRWCTILANLLLKKDLFHLENVNILFDFGSLPLQMNKEILGLIFGVLKANHEILTHQFTQLNIGILNQNQEPKRCDILQWNAKIDDTYLNVYEKNCKESDQSEIEYHKNVEKYDDIRKQWLD